MQNGLGTAIEAQRHLHTTMQILAPLDDGFLDRAHRFIRLWLATGYKMWELDLLLHAPAVGNGTLDGKTLVELLAFRQLQDATKLAVDAQLACTRTSTRRRTSTPTARRRPRSTHRCSSTRP